MNLSDAHADHQILDDVALNLGDLCYPVRPSPRESNFDASKGFETGSVRIRQVNPVHLIDRRMYAIREVRGNEALVSTSVE